MTLTPTVLTDAEIYFAGADLTGFANNVQLQSQYETLDRTTFASNRAKEVNAGLPKGTAAIKTFWQAGDASMPDDSFWANLGNSGQPLTVLASGGAVGDLAYLTRVVELGYTQGAQVGQNVATSSDMQANWPIARGQILHPQGTARTATGNGTARQVGALAANKALYVCLHVLGYTDGSMTVAIQSDDNSGMTTPTTQATFTAATALGGQTAKISGAITDDWWRATWTITGGATHSFLFAISAGIGPK